MVSLLLFSQIGTAIYIVTEVLVIFGGAMAFTWLVTICVRRLMERVSPPKPALPPRKRPPPTISRSQSLIDLRLQVESTRLETERLRLEQERLRAEREAQSQAQKGD